MTINTQTSKVVGVILTYKHASFLEDVVKKIPVGVFDSVFISNDESGDRIEEVAQKLGITCFSHQRLGYGGNLKFGFHKALEMGADYVVEIHGDGQYDIQSAVAAIAKIKGGSQLVLGSRFLDWHQPLRDKMPLGRFLANIGLSFLARVVTRTKLTEFHSGFRVYSRELLESINLAVTSNDFIFGFEILALAAFANFRISEVPVRCFYQNKHTSISILNSVKYAFQMTWILFKYLLAKMGFKVQLFAKRAKSF